MIKKIRNDEIFKKPEIQKIARSKKILNKGVKDNYKKIYIFSFTSIFIIFLFFSLPSIEKYLKIIIIVNCCYDKKNQK